MFFDLFKKKYALIIIVCKANITRSPYFALLLRQAISESGLLSDKNIKVESAGVDAIPGSGPNQIIANIAFSKGISLSKHRSKRFGRSHAKRASLVLTMEKGHKDKILEEYPLLEGRIFTILEFGRQLEDLKDIDIADPTGLEFDEFTEFVDTAEEEMYRIRNILALRGLP